MNTYTHFYLASKVEALFSPQQPADYFWGAVAPDVRYLAGLPRAQTHRARGDLMAMHARHPQCQSFLQGYQVHLLLDEIDLPRLILSAFPFSLFGRALRGKINQHKAAVLVELHYLQGPHPARPFGGGHNAVLDEIGLSPDDSRAFSDGLREYITAPSIDTAMTTFRRMGFIRTGQGEKYARAAHALGKSHIQRALMLWGVRNAQVEQKVVSHVREALKALSSKGFVVA
jgi:hypothetical protein